MYKVVLRCLRKYDISYFELADISGYKIETIKSWIYRKSLKEEQFTRLIVAIKAILRRRKVESSMNYDEFVKNQHNLQEVTA